MKQILLVFFVISHVSIFGQYSGGGTIYNYNYSSSGCGGEPSCQQPYLNAEDIYAFVVPFDGEVTYTATLTEDPVSCCGLIWTFNHRVQLVNYSGSIAVTPHHIGPGTFTDGSTCVQGGDTVKLRFWGTGGDYSYTLDFIPDPLCDPHDNNTIATATPVSNVTVTTPGCLKFHESNGPVVDNLDFFALDSLHVGDSISFHFDQTARVNYRLFRAGDPNLVINWNINTTSSEERNFVIQWNDEYYISTNSYFPAGCVYYSFRLEYNTPIPCDAEINDTKAQATVLTNMLDPVTGCLRYPNSGDNEDWFVIDSLNYGDSLTLVLDNTSRVAYSIYRDSFSNVLKSWNLVNTSDTVHFIAPWTDQYFIRTNGFWPNGEGNYSFDIDQNMSIPCDPEPNDTKATAYMPNDLGQPITGCVDFFGNDDNTDFIHIGYYEVGDTIEMALDVTAFMQFDFHRGNQTDFISTWAYYPNSPSTHTYRLIVPVSDDYYIQANRSANNNNNNRIYSITLDACPNQITINDSSIQGGRTAAQSLTVINCLIDQTAVLSAPEVLVSPLFESPLGNVLEINTDGCD